MILTQEFRENWSLSSKICFRFLFLFFISFLVLTFSSWFIEPFLARVGREILNIEGELSVVSTGSSDRTLNYVILFIQVVLSIFGTALWSVLDSKRSSYNKLFYWFIVVLRIFLVITMIIYGMVKVFKLQFPEASLIRLLEPLGDMSPMGLAWTYMGFSEGFNAFGGLMEVIGGVLLIPRRTQTLGAFIVMGIMIQVVMMNLFYDIPVKLFSMHLVGMATVIFITDISRFINVFIANRPTSEYHYFNPIKNKTYHKLIFWGKGIFLVILLGFFTARGFTAERTIRDKRDKPPLYGIWEVYGYIENNDTIPPLLTHTSRWRYLVIDKENYADIKRINDSVERFTMDIDTSKLRLGLYRSSRGDFDLNFNYLEHGKDTLWLQGLLEGDHLNVRLKRKDHTQFELLNRGFHWINEYPRNR